VCYHSFQSVYAYLKDTSEGFLSDSVQKARDCPFQALPFRDLIFGTFVLQMNEKQGFTQRRVGTENRVRHLLDLSGAMTFGGRP
jgi:hypothetical protein